MPSTFHKLLTSSRAALTVFAIACADAAGPMRLPLASEHLLALETFDGSGQAVHPDAAITPSVWVEATPSCSRRRIQTGTRARRILRSTPSARRSIGSSPQA